MLSRLKENIDKQAQMRVKQTVVDVDEKYLVSEGALTCKKQSARASNGKTLYGSHGGESMQKKG